jgi:penicillin-binding protein 2
VVSTDYRSLILENPPKIANIMDMPNDAYLSYTQGMEMVAHYGDGRLTGTAVSVFNKYPVRVCAKTGTAQTGIRNQDDNGAFVCYAPASKPEIAIAVYGEKAGSGSAMGAVAKGILDSYFDIGASAELPTYENSMS